jgi:hypothetical protein
MNITEVPFKKLILLSICMFILIIICVTYVLMSDEPAKEQVKEVSSIHVYNEEVTNKYTYYNVILSMFTLGFCIATYKFMVNKYNNDEVKKQVLLVKVIIPKEKEAEDEIPNKKEVEVEVVAEDEVPDKKSDTILYKKDILGL